MSARGYPGLLAAWQRTLGELIAAGADMPALERVIDSAGLDPERRSVLWLWAWSRRRDERAARA